MRWSRFSLRFLMIVTTLVAVWVSTVQQEIFHANRVSDIRGELVRRRIDITLQSGRFARLRRLVGDQNTDDIVAVEAHGFNGRGPLDEDFKLFKNLRRLKSINFDYTIISDAALVHISHLHVQQLSLIQSKITDNCLSSLVRMRKLEELNLRNTRITDKSVEGLSAMSHLKRLDVSYTRITAQGASQLETRLPGCTVIWKQP